MRAVMMVSLIALAGCSMNPSLERPIAPVAASYPLAEAAAADAPGAPEWRAMFGDARLQRLIALALAENRDLRIAALNAEAARAQLRVQRGALLPAAEAQGAYTRQSQPSGVAGASADVESGQGGQAAGVEFGQFTAQAALTAFEIDLFGRLRSLSQAAAERYLASQEGRRAAQIAVIAAVADAYVAERLADEQIRLVELTLVNWRGSRDVAAMLHAEGQVGGLDVTQAEALVRQAEADLVQRRRERAQATNLLTLAVGAPPPADLPPAIGLMRQPIRTALNPGLPSDLLLRRPDILRAEHELHAANADVGAARAAFFPRLSLTAAFGFASLELGSLFDGDSRAWSFTPSLTAPIFQGGQLRGNLDLAEVRKSIAVANYERAIQAAFREVADGLAGRATYAVQLDHQRAALGLAERRVALSRLRYEAGVDGRLELLDAQRSAYATQQALAALRRDEIASAIGLYRALGGGLE